MKISVEGGKKLVPYQAGVGLRPSGTSREDPPLQEATPFHPFCRHVISAYVPALSTGGGSGSGGGEDNPLGPDNPGGPNHEWFRRGAVDPRKWDAYLFDPDHPQNEGKVKGWLDTLGVGKGDGPRVERAIREQLDQAEIVEVDAAQHAEVPGRRSRKWNLVIASFVIPGRRPAPVLTVWAQDPSEEYPHLVTAVVRP